MHPLFKIYYRKSFLANAMQHYSCTYIRCQLNFFLLRLYYLLEHNVRNPLLHHRADLCLMRKSFGFGCVKSYISQRKPRDKHVIKLRDTEVTLCLSVSANQASKLECPIYSYFAELNRNTSMYWVYSHVLLCGTQSINPWSNIKIACRL